MAKSIPKKPLPPPPEIVKEGSFPVKPVSGKSILDSTIEAKKKELAELENARKEEIRVQRRAHQAAEAQKVVDFAAGIYKRYGVENNPKRDKCFGIAWEMGHAYGLSEVENYFAKLVELIQP